MLAVFNKRKDSIKTVKEAENLERQMNAIYFSMMKKLAEKGEYPKEAIIQNENGEWGFREYDDDDECNNLCIERATVRQKCYNLKQQIKKRLGLPPFIK